MRNEKPQTGDKYTATIGIECHVQLKTKTKMFSAVSNDARDADPNTLISHIDLGMPGALPVLNQKAVELAIRAAFALGTEPQHFSKFDRKHYFYPDLPKGYQISQFDQPIILGGYVGITVSGKQKRINITRAHLEEDAGKSTHPAGKDYSLVDLNRAGTPLLEIVSEPEMHTAEEAKTFAHELWLLMRYAEVSEADLYQGNMRFDVNVSVSKDDSLGTRSETKNLNSFKSVEKAVEFEIDRQIDLLEKGGQVVQETRGWDDAKQKTFSQRTKEDAHDYRYFPDPDLPPIVIEVKDIKDAKATMPALPTEWRERLSRLGLDNSATETIIEQGANNVDYLHLLDRLIEMDIGLAAFVAKFQLNDLPGLEKAVSEQTKKASSTRHKLTDTQYIDVYSLIKEGKLNSNKAKNLLFNLMGLKHDSNAIKFANEHGYIQVSDEAEIAKIVTQVLADNPKAAEDVRNGEIKAIGFLVGQIMKASHGKANPGLAQELITKQLKN